MSAMATEQEIMMTEAAGTMKAIVRDRFGTPDVLELREIEKPELVDDAVLVRVHAASVNRVDWYGLTGTPWFGRVETGLFKPKQRSIGVDFAGTVDAVGKDVHEFKPGDEVFGGGSGSLAEYVLARKGVALKPANVTFEEAAAVPVAALTALQGLRDKGKLQPGQKVLINGASGGVGTCAVQVAKALGGEVTAVCRTRNVERAHMLGADHVVDYTKEDFTRSGRRYDVIFDVAGNRSWRECKRVLNPRGTLVMAGAPKGTRLLGPLSHVIRVFLASWFGSRKAVFFVAKFNRPDVQILAELLESGKLTPVVERRYELSEAAEALQYMGEGHAQGKLVVTV